MPKGVVSVRVIIKFHNTELLSDNILRLPGISPCQIGVDGPFTNCSKDTLLSSTQLERSLNDGHDYTARMNNNPPRRVYCRDWKGQKRVCTRLHRHMHN